MIIISTALRPSVCCLVLLWCTISGIVVKAERIAETKCKEWYEATKTISLAIPLTLDPPTYRLESSNCSNSVGLIVGGKEAEEGEFPHQALLGYNITEESPKTTDRYDFQCGGSLISERFVLTAAHCMKYAKPVVVRLGVLEIADGDDGSFDYGIDFIRKHPNYINAASYHDIALIKLSTVVSFEQTIVPACLWTEMAITVDSVIASGFGHTKFGNDKISPILRKVKLDFLDRSQCENQFNGLRNFRRGILPQQLCIGSKRGGRDTCQGDSGGPVQTVRDPSQSCVFHVIGVTSVGSFCGTGQSPAVYTRVASYIDWIEEVVWKSGAIE
ncbi:serine protease snake-like [Uranotaenia lowii]|uniref:serine protease snake-like n=1 Tax=Uranotaenia lowii TaxID=190385 RepID=UPI00247ADADC|nr:serine protease snake-like [Uranotaenia lowii]